MRTGFPHTRPLTSSGEGNEKGTQVREGGSRPKGQRCERGALARRHAHAAAAAGYKQASDPPAKAEGSNQKGAGGWGGAHTRRRSGLAV